ncbi:MAG: hypothetical protein ACM3S1_07695 [Hyphomicrobiales bacterium]
MRNDQRPLWPLFGLFACIAVVCGWALYSGAVYDMTSGASIGLIATMVIVAVAFCSVIAAAAVLAVAAQRPKSRVRTFSIDRKSR